MLSLSTCLYNYKNVEIYFGIQTIQFQKSFVYYISIRKEIMESLSLFSCISSVLIFILLAVPGYVSRKFEFLSTIQIDGFAFILVNILWPAMIIDSMTSVTISESLVNMGIYTAIISIIVYTFSIIIAVTYVKIRKLPNALGSIFIFAIAFNNTGFIGMPFIKEVLGNEALFIASIIELVNDIFIFSIGIMLFQSSFSKERKINIKSFLSPGFISVIVGLLIFSLHIYIPELIKKPIGYLSNATTAMAMFLVGAQLGETSLKELYKETKAYEINILRLLVIPSLLFVFLYLTSDHWTLANSVLVLMFGTPVATCTAIFARQYRCDYRFATKCVMISTFFSAITLPIWLLLTSRI